MTKYRVLFNPLAGNGQCEANAHLPEITMNDGEFVYEDITTITDYSAFFAAMAPEEHLLIAGGDGTLNRFVNDTEGLVLPEHIDYFPAGTGNDFAADIGMMPGEIAEIGRYLKDLPKVKVNGRVTRFINGVGYGIDGYCCEIGDKQKEVSDKPVNYAGIAIRGLLFDFSPRKATVTVDGETHVYQKVWLAPCMNGRCYGGGMRPTPDQDRLSPDRTLSVLIWHDSGKLPTLTAFPGIFKGEHLKHEKMCQVLTGKTVKVAFDPPCALQIDGETVLNVSSYEASKE